MKNEEQVLDWFKQYSEFIPEIKFDDLENKLHPMKQVGVVMFLASKLKEKK